MRRMSELDKALRRFSIASRILKEDYGMSRDTDYGDEYGYDETDNEDAPDYDDYEVKSGDDEKTDEDLSNTDERISQIREIALGGLQDYAHDVDGEAYQFYKKIWLMCDKAVSEKDSASGNGGV